MRKLIILFLLPVIAGVLSTDMLIAQEQPEEADRGKKMVIKNDNSRFIGVIIHEDPREVIIETENLGQVAIPKHEIREIRNVNDEMFRDGIFIGEELFATRYFLTTNGLPVKKGDNYIQWNLFGPDFQFGIADNFGVGVMTSWFAMPIIGTAKYSRPLGEKTSLAIGGLLGTGSWAQPDFGILLPFVAITRGTRLHNINFSAGYGYVFYSEEIYNPNLDRSFIENHRDGRLLLSLAAMTKITNAFSLVFDSFIMPPGPEREYREWNWHWDERTGSSYYVERVTRKRSPALMVFVPGLRWQTRPNAAFQFGFTGAYFDGEFMPVPIPMLQWFRNI
jgi:hypothetical protein